jgi:DNA-binding NarL/FixJ family response regulator
MLIILCSNFLHPEHIIQAYEQGANLYYTKPASFTDLIKGLKELVHLDWTDPYSITEAYWHNGKYSTFKVA